MTSLLKISSLPAAILALALGTGVASAQPVGQTPLTSPIQQTGSVTPSVSSSCGGLISDRPIQILQVGQDFAAVDVAISGTGGLTLLIQGDNGFSECHTSSNGAINAPGLLNRGTYSFFIGNSSQTPTNYSLTISEN